MKKLALTGIATLAIAAGAFAQGLVSIDDSLNANGVAEPAGTYYSGPFGIEVWGMSGSTLPSPKPASSRKVRARGSRAKQTNQPQDSSTTSQVTV